MNTKREKYIAVRITKEQHDDLFHHAKRLGVTISDLIRLRIFQNVNKSVDN